LLAGSVVSLDCLIDIWKASRDAQNYQILVASSEKYIRVMSIIQLKCLESVRMPGLMWCAEGRSTVNGGNMKGEWPAK
jgi:hypothetical protein